MLLSGSLRLQSLISQESQISFELIQISDQMLELQNYASSIADGITPNDLATAPPSIFGRMAGFKIFSDMYGAQESQKGEDAMRKMYTQQLQAQGYSLDSQNQFFAYQKAQMFEKAKEEFAKVEQKLLNAQEAKLKQAQSQKQTQLTMIQGEEKNLQEGIDKEAKDCMPHYA